ncbi:MAG TPA: VIT1/CCC1 transporter family protein [bacterium]|jgi:VIT1/CCC1 family predicted Fe2+/Mn2+ transporter
MAETAAEHSHKEEHFSGTETVRDIVIGMSDGLTVPFALAAGLSGAVDQAHIVVIAGLAEIAAGAIAMGLGGYLAAKTESEHYASERKREEWECVHLPERERAEVEEVLMGYGVDQDGAQLVTTRLMENRKKWVDFMMRFELGLEEPDPKRARVSAATIGVSYIVGGLVPLFPYMLMSTSARALVVSVIVTLIALFIFGFVKGHFTGISTWRSGLQTMLIGGLAAAAAFGIAKWISA